MGELAQALAELVNKGILPSAFVIGSVAFFVALIGKIPSGNTHIDIPAVSRFLLGFFGFVFAFASLSGVILSVVVVSRGSSIQSTQQPPVVVTPTVTTQPQSNTDIQTSECSRSGDEINVGVDSLGPCAVISDVLVAAAVSQPSSFSDLIDRLDTMCENTVDACYQYREIIPTIIPASRLSRQRVLWGDIGYVSQAQLEDRIERLRCEGNICVYLITDDQAFEIGNSGRGLLLDQSYPSY